MRFPLFHSEMVIPTILTSYLYFNHQNLNEFNILIIFVIVIIVILGSIYWFLYLVITEITAHLGIYCFTLKKRVKSD